MDEILNQGVAPAARQATMREFLAVVFRRRWIILGLFIVTTLTVIAISFSTPVSYISSGRVLLRRGEQTSALDPGRQLYSDWEQDFATEVQVAKSVRVLEDARAILRREPMPGRGVLALDPGQVDIEVLGKSNVLGIGYVDRDPAVAERVCDALIRAYVDFREHNLGVLSYPQQFFDSELAQVSAELEKKVALRRAYSGQSGLVDVPSQKQSLLNLLTEFKHKKSEIDGKLAEARTAVRVMRDLHEHPEISVPVPLGPWGSDALLQLNVKVVDQEARLAQMRERYRDDAPEIVNTKETLQTLRDLLFREVEGRIKVAEANIEVLEAQLEIVQRDIEDTQDQLAAMPEKESVLSEIDRDLTLLKSRYAVLVEKSDRARVTENTSHGLMVLILSQAGRAVPANKRDYVRLALAPGFSLVVGVGLAFFIDGLDITVRTSGQAEEAVDVPVLAALPERRRRA